MKAGRQIARSIKANARHQKLSKNRAKRKYSDMKVLDSGILSKAGKILGVKGCGETNR
jgi:hypothetical protein